MSELKYVHLEDRFTEDLLSIWADKDVIKYTNIKEPCTLLEIKNRIDILKDFDVFIVSKEDSIIGIIGCPCMDKENLHFGLFYQFRKSSWHKGYAKASTKWLLEFMREKYGEITIFADVVHENVASEKILRYFGFKFISEDNYFERDGVNMKIHNYRFDL